MNRIQKALTEIETRLQTLIEGDSTQPLAAAPETEPRRDTHPLADTLSMEIPAEPAADTPPVDAFLIVEGVNYFALHQAVVNLGRSLDNDLVFEDGRVSRHHAQLRAVRGRYVIFDLGSTGGTFVNGQRVVQSATLFPGDVISLAGVSLIFGQDSPASAESTQELSTP